MIALDSDLRPMDTGHESMSLFSPSIGMISNNPYHYKGIEKQSIPFNNQLHNESNSQTISFIESEQHSQETPLYVNHPTTKYNKHGIIQPSNYSSSSPSSSNMKSYSPLGGNEDVEDLSILSENPYDRRNTIIQRDNNDYKHHETSSPSPLRHSLPTSQRGYHHNTTRYSHY